MEKIASHKTNEIAANKLCYACGELVLFESRRYKKANKGFN